MSAHRAARRHRLLFASLALIALAVASPAEAQQVTKVQGPSKTKVTKQHKISVQRARRQRVKPEVVRQLGTSLTRSALAGKKLGDPAMRKEIAVAPLASRLHLFKSLAKNQGNEVQSFTRRLRGMLKNGKTNRVTKSSKTFFEVLPSTVELFRESMGQNVIWFAASASPGHLHTLVADQNGGPNLTHNTYGTGIGAATISRMQYMAPAQLNQSQMARFTSYLNAGSAAKSKTEVYGFKNSRGETVYQTACTNWATSAPIGDLHRWAQSVDKNIIKEVKAGNLSSDFAGGLHSALVKAETPAARKAVLSKALKAPGLSKWTKSSAKRLGKEFDTILKQFPSRPHDLVARQSLSQIMGVSRSQDPAKWMYDLMLSKSVPVVGVLSTERNSNFKKMEFDLQIMGVFNEKGQVVKGTGFKKDGLGVIPAERGGAAE